MNFKLQEIKNLLILISPLYFIIVGLSWIFFHVYIRFIVERSSYFFQDVKNNFTIYHLVGFCLFVIFHIVLIILSILEIRRRKKQTRPLPQIILSLSQKVSKIINYLYWRPLEYLHDLIAPILPYSAAFFLYLVNQWTIKKRDYLYFYTLILIFDIMPKVILAICFFIDIIIYNQMKLVVYLFGLLILPILFSIFLKLLISCGTRNFPVIKDYFSEISGINPVYNDKGEIVSYQEYKYIVKEEYVGAIDPKEEMLLLIALKNMEQYGLKFKEDIMKLQPYIILMTSLLYFTAGLGRLYLIFLN